MITPEQQLAQQRAKNRVRQDRWRKKHGYTERQKEKARRQTLKTVVARVSKLEEQLAGIDALKQSLKRHGFEV